MTKNARREPISIATTPSLCGDTPRRKLRVEEWRPHANNFPRKDRDNQGHQVPVTSIQPEESCVRHQTVKEILTLFLLSDREACLDWAEYLAEEAMVELLHT